MARTSSFTGSPSKRALDRKTAAPTLKPILVTEPHRPSRAAFDHFVDEIWDRNWFTNNGPLVAALEDRLSGYLGLPNLAFVTNGTTALQIALEALQIKGEVLTTAFSFVATSSSIAWQKLRPRMVDVDPLTLNIDPSALERSITKDTTCILATHVFGNPCDVEAIEAIARPRGLKVIYDGAHAFAVTRKGRSLLSYGDAAIVSFHATKLFHTVEGGAVIAADPEVFERVRRMRSFGMTAQGDIDGVGINGKNSELHAAMGLANMEELSAILSRRQAVSEIYDSALTGLPLRRPTRPQDCVYNYGYYPVIFDSEADLLRTLHDLNKAKIFPRRYFHPSLSVLSYVDKGLGTPVSEDISTRIACLPLHTSMTLEDAVRVAASLQTALGSSAGAERLAA